MSLQSKPYFWVRCDNCGTDCEYGDFSAMADAGQAEDGARDDDWSCEHGKHHCPNCPPLCEKCGENAGDLAGERDFLCPACFENPGRVIPPGEMVAAKAADLAPVTVATADLKSILAAAYGLAEPGAFNRLAEAAGMVHP